MLKVVTVMSKKDSYKCDDFEMWVEKEGHVFVTFPKKVHLTAEIIKKLSIERVNICNGKARSVLVDFHNVTGMDKAAREESSSKESALLINVVAVVIKGMLQITLINFLIKYNKPLMPMRMFNNKEKALKWLKKQEISKDN